MKKYLLKLLLFLVPIVIMAYPLDIFISNNLKKSKWFGEAEYLVWNDIYGGKINSDIVIYGSSKSLADINPLIIQDSLNMSCYNLGLDGHNFWLEYLRHLELLKYNPKPKVIIFSIDALSLHRRDDFYNYEQFLPYIFSDNVYAYTSSYKGYTFLDYKLPLYRYFGESEAFCVSMANFFSLERNKKPGRIRGFRGKDAEWSNELELAKASLGSYKVYLDSASVHLFKRFIHECDSMDIALVMVLAPENIGGQKFISNRSEVIDLYNKIFSDYSVPFIDYSRDSLCYKTTWYYNSMHLNKKGADIFTSRLVGDLKKIEEIRKIIKDRSQH